MIVRGFYMTEQIREKHLMINSIWDIIWEAEANGVAVEDIKEALKRISTEVETEITVIEA